MQVLSAAVIAIATAGIAALPIRRGNAAKRQTVAQVLLITYIFLVFASTVFFRTSTKDYCYELMPFWSYREIVSAAGESGVQFWRTDLFWEDILNVFMLLPEGVLMPIVINDYKCNRKRQVQPLKNPKISEQPDSSAR
jgi:glycopeptide antibiotics resistance protein